MSRMTLAALSDDLPTDGTEVEVDNSEAVVEEISTGPEQDLDVVADVAADVEAGDAVIDEAADGAEALDDIAGAVDEANKEGGLDAPAAEAIRIAVEHISRRAGLVVPARFAVEGFKSKTSRVQAGRMASEDIKEQAKKIWDYIVKMWEKVKAWVIKWFNNLFDGATKLKNRAEKLVKAAEAKVTAGDKVDAKKLNIVSPAYAEKLVLNGALPTAESIVEIVADRKAGVFEVSDGTEINDSLTKVLESIDNEAAFKAAVAGVTKTLDTIGHNGTAVDNKKFNTAEDMTTYEIVPMLGGKSVYASVPKKVSEKVADSLGKVKWFVGASANAKNLVKLDMKALQPDQAKQVAASIVTAADALIQEKKNVAEFQKSMESVTTAAKRMISNNKDESKERARQASRIAKALISSTTQGLIASRSHEIASFGAALAYVAASLALAGKDAPAAAAAAA